MEQTKIEVSKPILSPTRSLDEGFESDPDRISTDSELAPSAQPLTFDLHHRIINSNNSSKSDNAQHSRYNAEKSSPISSIICLDEAESDTNAYDENGMLIIKVSEQQTISQQSPKSDQQQQKQHIYRRIKNKAPLPPKSNSTNSIYQTIQQQPRSQSVDRIQRSNANANEFNKSSTPPLTGNSSSTNQNILAGRFVRVTVDPKNQYLNYFKNYKSYQNYQTTNSGTRLSATTGSSSNLYKVYHTSSNSNKSSISNMQQHNSNSHESSGGLLSLSNLSSTIMPMQYGYSTVKAPKSYLHAAQHFSHHHLHHQQQPPSIQQSHFLASSWTQSMDPRKARK